jgi:hypothetical protein
LERILRADSQPVVGVAAAKQYLDRAVMPEDNPFVQSVPEVRDSYAIICRPCGRNF